MTTPLEHDYIGLSEITSMESSDKISSITTTTTTFSDSEKNSGCINNGLNLKATELRLGLPGSESPERISDKDSSVVIVEDNNNNNTPSKNGYPLSVLKILVSGAKRGFSDTINSGGAGNWVFSASGGSDIKNGGFISPKGKGLVTPAAKDDGVPKSPRPATVQEKKTQISASNGHGTQISASNGHGNGPSSKAQVVGWPPIRSFRKNTMASNPPKNDDNSEVKLGSECLYVKVSMDGAPYLRKVDLKTYGSYVELSSALEKMFSCFTIGQCGSDGVPNGDVMNESHLMDLLHGSEYVLTYEDKDGDWMLVGDVPWVMFTETCKRLRIMKSSDAVGLAPRAMEKCKNRN